MRPSHDKLLGKLKRLDILKDNPEGMFWLLGQLSHWSFVHQARHPDWIARLIAQLHGQWELAAGVKAKFEIPENAVTTEDALEKRSLRDQLNEADLTTAPKNNTTPGPSHKSPVLYRNAVGAGFTVPGVEGRFVWHGTEPKQEPPNMEEVVQKLAKGLHLGEAPDLNDKKLKKRVREIIWEHTLDCDAGEGEIKCDCGEFFEFGEDWAVHVRKLIWKELKKA